MDKRAGTVEPLSLGDLDLVPPRCAHSCLFPQQMPSLYAASSKLIRFYHGITRLFPCSTSWAMRIKTTVLFAAVLTVGSIASLPRLCAEGPDGSVAAESRDGSSCADRYNALLGQAKASLVKGDRNAAINSLIAAKIQLRTCQELEERNSTASIAVALNSTQSARIE